MRPQDLQYGRLTAGLSLKEFAKRYPTLWKIHTPNGIVKVGLNEKGKPCSR